MSKLTIADAAEQLGISKEAIHNRVRRGSLQSVLEDGIKFVIMDTNEKASTKRTTVRRVNQVVDDRYYKLLEEQNTKLQERVSTLETETRSLRDQKELMLIDERKKIEQIYKEKDEQLKNILSTISSQFMLNTPELVNPSKNKDLLEAEIEEPKKIKTRLVSLNKHLKTTKLSKKKIKKIKNKIKENTSNDNRIIKIGKKHYLDLNKYDYSDLSL